MAPLEQRIEARTIRGSGSRDCRRGFFRWSQRDEARCGDGAAPRGMLFADSLTPPTPLPTPADSDGHRGGSYHSRALPAAETAEAAALPLSSRESRPPCARRSAVLSAHGLGTTREAGPQGSPLPRHVIAAKACQPRFVRRRSRMPKTPVTRARIEPMPAGSISGTAAGIELARRKP